MSIFVQNLAWYNEALLDHTELVLFVLLWQFRKFLFKNNGFTCSSELPQTIGNAHQSFHLMEAQKKKKSLMVQKHSKFTNSAWLQPASTTRACFPSPVISTLCQLIFGKCPLVPWMYSRVCAWPDVLYWLSLTESCGFSLLTTDLCFAPVGSLQMSPF